MPVETQRRSSPGSRSSDYVESRKGFRGFVLVTVLSLVLGLSLRLYLNPSRIKDWLTRALDGRTTQFGIHFGSARLTLARGSLPVLAIELTDIDANPAGICRPQPSLKIAKLSLPLNFRALIRGHLAIGMVSAEDLIVDLDGLKADCTNHAQHKAESAPSPTGIADHRPAAIVPDSQPTASGPPTNGVQGAVTSAVTSAAAPLQWWSPEHVRVLQDLVDGFEFSRVEVDFEEHSKKVNLQSFLLVPGDQLGTVHLESVALIPPELTYGETLPALHLTVDSSATEARVLIKAGLSEGTLQAKAVLHPAVGGFINAQASASVVGVPLSTLVPLVTKSGVISGAFQPRFMWMTCQASIEGRFQGMFVDHPLALKDCSIEGSGASIRAESAVRRPDGTWEPFAVTLQNVDLGQLLATFDWRGPEGIFSDYGRLEGRLLLIGKEEARFEGRVQSAKIRFSNRNVRADQRIIKMVAKAELNHGQITGALNQLELENGDFDGGLEVALGRHASDGTIKASIRHLHLASAVQKVLIDGHLDDLAGTAVANLADGKLTELTGSLKLTGLTGREIKSQELTVVGELSDAEGDFSLTLNSAQIDLNRSSKLFQFLQPVFYAHQFPMEWISIKDPIVRARFRKETGLRWEKAEASMEDRRIRLLSSGQLTPQQELSGWLLVDYPSVKKIKWLFAGHLESPSLGEDAKSTSDRMKGLIAQAKAGDERALGLANQTGSTGNSPSTAPMRH